VFTPIPAVDIRGGRCVRLVQGDFSRETRYADDPAEMARHWEDLGARRLHVVDLDGARDGQRANADVIRRVLRSVTIPVQVGGGIRSLGSARALIHEGADRVVIGTAAAEQPEVLGEWVAALGVERVVVGVDAREGQVATHGWTTTRNVGTVPFCERLVAEGVRRVVFTDVGRDGLLGGPNIAATGEVARILAVIGSGGVSTVEHLRALADAGAEGAIIGTALYEGRLSLSDALGAAAC
jgi:phosphoribosylformimino-5-aminoimidazole carboxamide ribotide isomerase